MNYWWVVHPIKKRKKWASSQYDGTPHHTARSAPKGKKKKSCRDFLLSDITTAYAVGQ
jgi:hypothetical protein